MPGTADAFESASVNGWPDAEDQPVQAGGRKTWEIEKGDAQHQSTHTRDEKERLEVTKCSTSDDSLSKRFEERRRRGNFGNQRYEGDLVNEK